MNVRILQHRQFGLAILGIWLATSPMGCQKAYYKTMEQFGYHKREIMVDRVKDARDAQKDAKKQFQSALERFSAVSNFSGGNLEKKYGKLKGELEDSEERAEAVSEHIADVEDVGRGSLFGMGSGIGAVQQP